VRNGVVNMQQVEIVQLRNLCHARGQCQIVRRVIEQRVTRNLYLVIMNIGFFPAQPDGLGIRDEMNFVTALGQFQSEFRSHYAAAAVGGIARDPNLHPRISTLFRESVIRW
jgi:hypothetical protein